MRTVIVTGGSRGLGLAIAAKLAATGYRAVAVARSAAGEFAEAEKAAAGLLAFRAFDLADAAGIGALMTGIRKEFGPVFGLVNNAGIGTSGMLATMRIAEIERTVRLNTVAPMVLAKHFLRSAMVSGTGQGRIVNISSIVAATGFSGLSVYGATKASMVGFTRSLAREAGPLGITVNAVAPGFVDTAMTEGMEGAQREQVIRRSPLKRLVAAGDVAETVAFLMSDAARNITGTVVTVDAGGTA